MKKILVTLMVSILCVSLTACQSNVSDEQSSDVSDQSVVSEPSSTPNESTTSENEPSESNEAESSNESEEVSDASDKIIVTDADGLLTLEIIGVASEMISNGIDEGAPVDQMLIIFRANNSADNMIFGMTHSEERENQYSIYFDNHSTGMSFNNNEMDFNYADDSMILKIDSELAEFNLSIVNEVAIKTSDGYESVIPVEDVVVN